MTSVRTRKFKEAFQLLPPETQELAYKAYALWREDSSHGKLYFKKVDEKTNVWSVRIDRKYRALAIKRSNADGSPRYVWYWIGEHDTYMRYLRQS